jgi:hypothetical protein
LKRSAERGAGTTTKREIGTVWRLFQFTAVHSRPNVPNPISRIPIACSGFFWKSIQDIADWYAVILLPIVAFFGHNAIAFIRNKRGNKITFLYAII